MKAVMDFFGMSVPEFRREWAKMTDADKAQLKEGIANGSLTY